MDYAIGRVMDRGQFLNGPEVEAFEEEFADFVGARYAISVGSGLAALSLTLKAWGVGPGDEVVVPANTFIATWLAVTSVGAHVIPVEPNPSTYNMDASALASVVGPHTKVVIPVHLYGQPCAMDPILEIAREHGVKVLQDAAQAHGARYRGQPLGGFGDAAAWSFYPAKNLGALGDGGAVTTNDSNLAESLRRLRNYGSVTKYVHEIIGENSRLSSLNAAVLRVKLRHLNAWNQRRQEIAAMYQANLPRSIRVPTVPDAVDPVWHLYVVQTSTRQALAMHLGRAGIETMVHYPIPPHRQPAYRHLAMPWGTFPLTERISGRILSLPMGPHLTDAQVARVIAAMHDFAMAEPGLERERERERGMVKWQA
jgi:dTDP-4-amino-4,6-dideoxygalactose transaminase